MKTTVTITSKRQITIPKKVWDALGLEGQRYLNLDIRKDEFVLQKVAYQDRMQQLWAENERYVRGDVSDESISQTVRKYYRHKKDV